MMERRHRLGVLLSGRGSNFVAIADSIAHGSLSDCEVAVVLSNVADAAGLNEANARGIPAISLPSRGIPRDQHDSHMIAALREHAVDLVILAGYMRVLTPAFLRASPGPVLNIHPSLLPAFPGLHAQRQALEYGAKVTGCTVHFVDEAVDHGTIVLQRTVPMLDDDTEQGLSARILVEEHKAYPEAIAQVLSGKYETRGRRWMPRTRA